MQQLSLVRGSWVAFGLVVMIGLSGCAKNKDYQQLSQQQAATIQSLNQEIARLNQELDQMLLSQDALLKAKAELEGKLQSELQSGDMSLSMEERGLVVTMLDRILFDSGKAELKSSSVSSLNKVADVLKDETSDHMVYVEGHTDNIPIKHSSWKSNWELSTARATGVIHYFINDSKLDPKRLAAVGYGEFHPAESNDTAAGRTKNRRVEIVISPKKI